jgi:LPS export ABC transporter protein LptC
MAVIVVTVSAVIWSFIGHRQSTRQPGALLGNLDEDADMRLGKVHQTATRNGVKEWDLVAGSAKYHDDKKQVVFQDMTATFFLKEQQEVTLNADKGLLRTDTKDMVASGNVVVKNQDYTLGADALGYRHEDRTIFSEVPVVISGTAFRLSADRMRIDLEAQEAQFDGRVNGSFDEDITL